MKSDLLSKFAKLEKVLNERNEKVRANKENYLEGVVEERRKMRYNC
jgi:RNA:NAD 2'-phosphotransferase (TPT1/KptA family)